MTPGAFPLVLYRGDTYRWQFTLWTDAGKTQPADLTGVVVKAEVRAAPGGTLLTTLACTVALPNIITADLAAAACATLPTTGAWDMQLTYPDGHVATVLQLAVNDYVEMGVFQDSGAPLNLIFAPSGQPGTEFGMFKVGDPP